MKRFLLAALAALAFATPASAQYYGSPYSQPYEEWQPAPRYYEYDRPSYGYRPEPDRYGYERRVYRYERPAYEHRRYERPRYDRPRNETRRVSRLGNVCVTSRGSCEFAQPMLLNSRCRCDIPGFGEKRGFIQY